MSIILHHADCFDVFPSIKDESIDLILCDPPYGTTACKWDSILPLDLMWENLKRIVKPNAPIVMTGIQPFTTILISSNLAWFKYTWVWDKGRGTGFQISKIKPMNQHEDIIIFGKGKITYNPQMRPRDKPRISKNKGTTRQMLVSNGNSYEATVALTEKFPVTIITFPNNNQAKKVHPTQKPVDLLEYLIKTYSLEGQTVLDFTMGSGSTGVACKNLKRNFIGIEKEKEYYDIAKQRLLTEGNDQEEDALEALFKV
jgi:site-specific DNA-methyltransferase (adenine-specific)